LLRDDPSSKRSLACVVVERLKKHLGSLWLQDRSDGRTSGITAIAPKVPRDPSEMTQAQPHRTLESPGQDKRQDLAVERVNPRLDEDRAKRDGYGAVSSCSYWRRRGRCVLVPWLAGWLVGCPPGPQAMGEFQAGRLVVVHRARGVAFSALLLATHPRATSTRYRNGPGPNATQSS